MTVNQETINHAAAIIQNAAEPNFNHTNESGALFIKAKNIIFSAAGVSGFEKAFENAFENAPEKSPERDHGAAEEQNQGSDRKTYRSMTGIG